MCGSAIIVQMANDTLEKLKRGMIHDLAVSTVSVKIVETNCSLLAFMIMLCIESYCVENHKVCINDDAGLTFANFNCNFKFG